jgi:hypothetical protein
MVRSYAQYQIMDKVQNKQRSNYNYKYNIITHNNVYSIKIHHVLHVSIYTIISRLIDLHEKQKLFT